MGAATLVACKKQKNITEQTGGGWRGALKLTIPHIHTHLKEKKERPAALTYTPL